MPKSGERGRLRRFLFENQSVSQTIAKNTFWLSFGEIIGRLLRVIIIFYAARVLGTAGYGTFSYMTSLAAILTVFSDIGLSGVLIREAARDEARRDAYFSTSFILKSVLLLASLAFLIFGVDFITGIPLTQTMIMAIAALFVFDSLRRFGSSLFRAEERMEIEALINIATQVVIVAAGFFVLTTRPAPDTLAIAYAIGAGLGLVATAYFLAPYIRRIFVGFDRDLVKPIIQAAWPMTLASIFGVLLLNTDTVMIGWFADASRVGLYAAAQKPVSFFYLLPAFVVGGLFPALAKLAHTDAARFRAVMERGLRMVFLMAIPLATGIAIAAPEIITLFYGSPYLPAADSMRILALSLFMTFPATILIHAIFAHNRQKEMVVVWGTGAILNVALNLYMIPVFGIVGAAWASFTSQAITNAWLFTKATRISRFSLFTGLRAIVFGTFIMAAAVLFFSALAIPFIFTILIAFTLYLASLLLFKDQTLAELWEIMRSHP